MGYKETLNLPRTDFPMKADLAKREPAILKFWSENDIYKLVCQETKDNPLFILHDGPPYANGDIHLGTALNKVLKDIVVRYKSMTGYFSPFVPGWDCHGQPIEHEVEKLVGSKKANLSHLALRQKCKDYALKFVKRQAEQFKRLGVRGDWENPYLTLDHSYEATNIKIFGELYRRGLVYRGRKPIHWCPACETALAEAEIDYRDKKSSSIYVKFPIKNGFVLTRDYKEKVFFLIWTTTPWTLPANVAIAVNPKFKYSMVKTKDEIYILASNLINTLFSELGIAEYKVLLEVDGKQLEHLICQHPLMERDTVVVLADYVSLDQGTGCVHIAPGHGQEDYLTGLKYNLPSPMPVDSAGVFTEEAGKYGGIPVEEANKLIAEDLERSNLLLSQSSIIHQYPHCWRCKSPVIFRATEQWFIAVNSNGLRRKALEAIKQVKWIPSWSERRITSMVEERPDWCISRQRAWGVPIPVFYCKNCRKEAVTDETLKAVEDLFAKEGADAWFKKEAEQILPPGIKCSHCGQTSFVKETDILDVWFESGVSHAAVLKNWPDLKWPADLYLEGSDQHRGWFQSSLLTSVGNYDRPPYLAVLTHGFLVDGEGRKMSKSLGNIIDPLEVIQKSGADILRLWVASADYTSDIAVSSEILERITEAYRRIRNTARFILGNLSDFDLRRDRVRYEDLEELDKWVLLKLHQLIKEVTIAYGNYRFHQVFHAIYNFCVRDLSTFYLDVLKDRLYVSVATSKARRAAQTVLLEILLSLIKLFSPILAFTSEEIWQSLPESCRDKLSIQLSRWPTANPSYINEDLEARWQRILEIRQEVAKALEGVRNNKIIGDSLEAAVEIYAEGELYEFLQGYHVVLPTIFIVSQTKLKKGRVPAGAYVSQQLPDLKVLVRRADGKKCERCWTYSISVGTDSQNPNLCARCLEIIG